MYSYDRSIGDRRDGGYWQLRLIIDSLVAIETAAKNVEQNEKDCKQMGKYIGLLTRNLRRIQNNELLLMRMDSDLSATVEAIKEINDEAKMLVEECKVKRNIICRLWTAGEISKKLSLMNQSINTTTNFLILAINNRQLEYQQDLLSSLHGDHPRPVQKVISFYYKTVDGPSPAAPDGEINHEQSTSIVNEIVGVADRIKARAKTARRDRGKCLEIDERVGIVSAFLPQLENTNMIKYPAMGAELEKIVRTFQHADELVTACQERNLFMIRPAQGCQGGNGGELSKGLHQVLDQMLLDLDGLTEISTRYTNAVRITGTLMAGRFGVKLRHLARQSSKTRTIQSIGQTSQLDASFKADPEEIEAVASTNESVNPSLLPGGTTSKAPEASSKD